MKQLCFYRVYLSDSNQANKYSFVIPEHRAKMYPGWRAGVCDSHPWASAVHWGTNTVFYVQQKPMAMFWLSVCLNRYIINLRIKLIHKKCLVNCSFHAIEASVQVLACVAVQNGSSHCSIPTLKSYDRWTLSFWTIY